MESVNERKCMQNVLERFRIVRQEGDDACRDHGCHVEQDFFVPEDLFLLGSEEERHCVKACSYAEDQRIADVRIDRVDPVFRNGKRPNCAQQQGIRFNGKMLKIQGTFLVCQPYHLILRYQLGKYEDDNGGVYQNVFPYDLYQTDNSVSLVI